MALNPASVPLRDVYTVSRLNETARRVLEAGLGTVWVEGEISNLARPASGHIYFSLKDSGAQIRCAMFRNRNLALGFRPENGLNVLAYGRISLYTARGDYQMIAESLEAAGDGLLRMRFEQLKRKLFAEGLFDDAHKLALPSWPTAIGVVTSPSSAAVRDVLTVLARRCPNIPVIIYPTQVQGESAAADIAAAIETAGRRKECDVLIVGRGGGSLEDLWPFNEERVARAIHASTIPIVSAVGHEIDFTIADLVADLRAATPSAAAELVSPDTAEQIRHVRALEQRLGTTVGYEIAARRRELRQLQARLISPGRRLETAYQRVDELAQRLAQSIATQTRLRDGELRALSGRLKVQTPARQLELHKRDIEYRRIRLHKALRLNLLQHTQRLDHLQGVLRALGPTSTLERGYAIVTDAGGRIVRDASTLHPSAEVQTRLARGQFTSSVISSDGGTE